MNNIRHMFILLVSGLLNVDFEEELPDSMFVVGAVLVMIHVYHIYFAHREPRLL